MFTLTVRDLVRISRADRHTAKAEQKRIVLVAGLVFPDSADKVVQATEQLVITEEDFASGKITTSQSETATKDIAAKAAAFGAPIAAVSRMCHLRQIMPTPSTTSVPGGATAVILLILPDGGFSREPLPACLR